MEQVPQRPLEGRRTRLGRPAEPVAGHARDDLGGEPDAAAREYGYPSPALPPRPDYTQVSDVEGELNGLMAYPRAVLKPDAARLKAAHDALIHDASRVTPRGARWRRLC
jgi:hypothetical protein